MPIVVKDASGNDVELLTKEEQAEMVTGAVRSQLDKSNKKLAESLLKEVGDSVKKTLDEYEELRTTQSGDAGDDEQTGHQAPSIDEHPTVRGLKKQMDDLKRQADEARAQAQSERNKQRDVALRQSLAEQLTKSGVDPKYVRQAVGILVDADKRVRYSEDGDQLTFRDADGSEVDLGTGLKGWVKSDDAKIFLPPRGASGSGDRLGGKPVVPATAGQQPKGQVGRAILSMISAQESVGQTPSE